MLQSWCQKAGQPLLNMLLSFLQHNRLPYQQYDLLDTPLTTALGAYNLKPALWNIFILSTFDKRDWAQFWQRLKKFCRWRSEPHWMLRKFKVALNLTLPRIKFDLDGKQNPWLKFEAHFLAWWPNRKKEKTTVCLLFSLFIQFSGIEIRLVFSRNACDKLIKMTRKQAGCPCSLVSHSCFSISRQIRHVFNMRVHEGVLNDAVNYALKGYVMQMWGITLSVSSNQVLWGGAQD